MKRFHHGPVELSSGSAHAAARVREGGGGGRFPLPGHPCFRKVRIRDIMRRFAYKRPPGAGVYLHIAKQRVAGSSPARTSTTVQECVLVAGD